MCQNALLIINKCKIFWILGTFLNISIVNLSYYEIIIET